MTWEIASTNQNRRRARIACLKARRGASAASRFSRNLPADQLLATLGPRNSTVPRQTAQRQFHRQYLRRHIRPQAVRFFSKWPGEIRIDPKGQDRLSRGLCCFHFVTGDRFLAVTAFGLSRFPSIAMSEGHHQTIGGAAFSLQTEKGSPGLASKNSIATGCCSILSRASRTLARWSLRSWAVDERKIRNARSSGSFPAWRRSADIGLPSPGTSEQIPAAFYRFLGPPGTTPEMGPPARLRYLGRRAWV